jgi:hypothetical protein
LIAARRFFRPPCYVPALSALLALPACATHIEPSLVTTHDVEGELCPGHEAGPVVSLRYLGSGGVLIGWRGSTVMTAPFFSNPSFTRVALGLRLPLREDRIDAGLPPDLALDALLIGHSHYDHLMDVPAVLQRSARPTKVFGSATSRNILAGDPAMTSVVEGRFVDLEPVAGDRHHPGAWLEAAPAVRVMAQRSDHAPQFWGVGFHEGEVAEPRTGPPRKASDWPVGPVYVFIVDLLDDEGRTAVRLHLQDAASDPPFGFPPTVLAARPFDIVVACVGGAGTIQAYPRRLLEETRPRLVLLSHWEDFFRDPARPIRGVRGTDVADVIEDVRGATDAPWFLPRPGTELRLRSCPQLLEPGELS